MNILDNDNNQFLANSSLLRGEQVFTSLLFFQGKFLFLSEHLDRLVKGAAFLFPKYRWESHKNELKEHLLHKMKNYSGNFYCRLTIVDDYFFVILKEHIPVETSVKLIRALQIKTPNLRPSFLKLGQYADSFLELKRAEEMGAGEIVFFDQDSFATETSTSNIFVLLRSGKLVTPYLSSTVLDGILRSQLCKTLTVEEANITEEDLLSAREIWITNSIKGIRFISSYQDQQMTFENTVFLTVLEKLGRYGEKKCE